MLLAGVGLCAPGSADGSAAPPSSQHRVLATTVTGAITPVIADHIEDGIARAERDGYAAYLIRLDTPGGLDTSMRAIVQDILAAEVPVIVHVSPRGARAASAGAIITLSAHVAAMAPGTAIGAATPVSGSGGEDLDAKIVNDAIAYATSLAELRDRDVEFAKEAVRDGRSVSADEALEIGAVDLLATTTDELLERLDGRAVVVGVPEREVVLETADAAVDVQDLGVLRTIQQFLADPNIAFLLLSIGTLGLIYELATPGIGAGGALGAVGILLAFFGLAVLPVDIVGILFLVLAAVLFAVEVVAPGLGIAAVGGTLSLVLSGVFLVDDAPGLDVSLAVVLPAALVVGVFVVVAGRIAMRSRSSPSTTTGHGALIGQRGAVRVAHGAAQLFVNGAWWGIRARDSDVVLVDGTPVEVVDVVGIHLIVEALPDGGASTHVTQEDSV
ncbi:MAG: nodulation protein NfeD [Acidimicrobiia bacterium]